MALHSHIATLTFRLHKHVVSVQPFWGRQYKRTRPKFPLAPILIFKTLANGHVFNHITEEVPQKERRCKYHWRGECEMPGQLDPSGPWLQPAGHLSHICRWCHQRRKTNTKQAEVMCFWRSLKGLAITPRPSITAPPNTTQTC